MTKTSVNKIPVRSHIFEHCNTLEKSDSCLIGTTWCKSTAITTKLTKTAIKISALPLGKRGTNSFGVFYCQWVPSHPAWLEFQQG